MWQENFNNIMECVFLVRGDQSHAVNLIQHCSTSVKGQKSSHGTNYCTERLKLLHCSLHQRCIQTLTNVITPLAPQTPSILYHN